MRLYHSLLGLAICLVASVGAPSARAQSSATAEALFSQGLADMEAGHYEAACSAFAECQRIDPTPGTLFTWAECEAKAGKVAAAYAHYTEYLRLVERMNHAQQQNHRERAAIAKSKQAALHAEVPTLRLILPANAPSGVRVTRDGVELDAGSLGTALPADPGEHRITTQLPGGPLVEQRIMLAPGDDKTLKLDVRTPEPKTQHRTPSPDVPPRADTNGGVRRAGFVIGGLGIAGLAAGSIAGAFALQRKGIVDEECDATRCSAAGLAAVESGRTAGTFSTAGFAIGLAGLATGAVLIFTAPDEKKPQSANAEFWAGVAGAEPHSVLVGMTGRF
jgi:tetratricopeptide (TPR) repeat protein